MGVKVRRLFTLIARTNGAPQGFVLRRSDLDVDDERKATSDLNAARLGDRCCRRPGQSAGARSTAGCRIAAIRPPVSARWTAPGTILLLASPITRQPGRTQRCSIR